MAKAEKNEKVTVWITRDADPRGGVFSLHFMVPDPDSLNVPEEIREVEVDQAFVDSIEDGTAPYDQHTRHDGVLGPLFNSGAADSSPTLKRLNGDFLQRLARQRAPRRPRDRTAGGRG